jgi:N-methylhydantoinase B
MGGEHPATGRPICWESIIGGIGARSAKDGIEATSSPWNGTNVPIEIQESRNPVLIERLELIADSAGPGQFRGGCGLRKDLRILTDAVTLTNLGDRHKIPPYGLSGGLPGAKGMTILNPGTRTERLLHSKGTYRLNRGDLISWRTSGAGGSGKPLARAPTDVLRDVLDGLVSLEAAARDYGVVIDIEARCIDERATSRLRARLARKASPVRKTRNKAVRSG